MGNPIAWLGYGIEAAGKATAGQKNKQQQEYNAQVAEYQSEDAIARGEEKERRHRVDTKRLIGSQTVALAAQGIAVDEGSALELLEDTAYQSEMDAITIRNNAAREAWGYKVQAVDYRTKGQIAEAEGYFGAGETILTGAGKYYGSGSSTSIR